jgi:hypothetical protein
VVTPEEMKRKYQQLLEQEILMGPEIADYLEELEQLKEIAKHDGVLADMIERDLPLTREGWISMNYLGHPPDQWTDEHEAEVPEPFQLNPQDEG